MYELVVTICTLMGACREFKTTIPEPPSLFGCGFYGQVQAAETCQRFPGYYLKRWTCRPASEQI